MAAAGPHMRSNIAASSLSKLDFFGDLRMLRDYRLLNLSVGTADDMSTMDPQHYFNFAGPSVASDNNQNLSDAQKELLMWHLRTGYSMYHLQHLTYEATDIQG